MGLRLLEEPNLKLLGDDDFDNILKTTLGYEGGFTVDSGGPTNLGITQNTLNAYRKEKGLPFQDVKSLDVDSAKEIYRDKYYSTPNIDKVPSLKAKTALFDLSVNSGPQRAIKTLQEIVGAEQDGSFGPKTQAATEEYIKQYGEDALAKEIINKRKNFLKGLIQQNPDKYKQYEKGWMNRINDLRKKLDLSFLNPVGEAFAAEEEIPQEKVIPSIRAMRPEERRYMRPLTEEERAQAVVDLMYKERGEEVPSGLKLLRAVESPEAKAVTEGILLPHWTALKAIKGIIGAVEPNVSIKDMLIDSAAKGIFEPENVEPASVSILKAYPQTDWKVAGIVGTLAEVGVLAPGLLKAMTDLSTSTVKGLGKDAQYMQALKATRETPAWSKAVQGISQSKNIPTEEVDRQLATKLWNIRNEANYFKVVNSNLTRISGIDILSEAGFAKTIRPKFNIGDVVNLRGQEGKIAELGKESAMVKIGDSLIKASLSQLKLPQPTGEGKVLYHETGSQGLDYLMSYSDVSGLNVSTDKSLALGQGGKGILVELNKDVLLGDRGSLTSIKKPGTEVVGQKEFRLVGGQTKPGTIKSITIKEGTPISKVQKAILSRDYDKVINEDKSATFTPKLSQPTPLAEEKPYIPIAERPGYFENLKKLSDEQLAEGFEKEWRGELSVQTKQLKDYLKGKLKPELIKQGEYADLKHLNWLFGKEGEITYTPDELVGELQGMGFQVENDNDVRELIKDYFKENIQDKAERAVSQIERQAQARMRAGLAKQAKPSITKPQRQEVGVGQGTVLNTKTDTVRGEMAKINQGTPFTLLGMKSEVISRLSRGLKNLLTQGIDKVYDLFGGAKGYRAGLFPNIPSENYHLNEFSDERFNYYKNIQDPKSLTIIKNEVKRYRDEMINRIAEGFEIHKEKFSPLELRKALNKWLTRGMIEERRQYARSIIQKYGDSLLKQASEDKWQSPESSAIYYFLQNTSVFGIKQTSDGWRWSQGIIRTSGNKAEITDTMRRIENSDQQLDMEAKRDAQMPLTKQDAWQVMDDVTKKLTIGELNPERTVVLVDPQYLNPTQEEGTYSVGGQDSTWAGHKQNLEQHLLPLAKTGVKIIYTNNEDINLTKWLKLNNLPYNVEEAIGATALRGGRDETISAINYKLPEKYTTLEHLGAKRAEHGVFGITGESKKFDEWLKQREQQLGRRLTEKEVADLRLERLKTISEQLVKIAEIAPRLITPKQIAYIHILKQKNYLTDQQYARLKKIFTGKRSLKVTTPTGKLKKAPVMQEEAEALTRGMEGVVPRKPIITGQPPVIPRTKALVPSEWQQPFNDLTTFQANPLSGLDPVRAAELVDRKSYGTVRKFIVEPAREAERRWKLELKSTLDKITSISRGMPSKSKPSELTFKYIEKTLTPEEEKLITPEMKNTAEYMSRIYDNLLIRINEKRSLLGKVPIQKRQDYITHIQELSLLDEFYQGLSNIPDDVVNIPSFSKSNSPFFKFALQRIGGKEFKVDAIDAFRAYISRAYPVIYNTDVLKSARPLVERLPPNAYKYFTQYLDETMALKPTQADRLVPRPLLRGISWLRQKMGKGAILGNVASVFNQIFTLPNSMSSIGPKWIASATLKSHRAEWRAFTEKYSKVLQGRIYEIDFDPTLLSRVDNALGFMLQWTDKEMVRIAWGAQFEKSLSQGTDFEQAIREADDMAFKTQSGFNVTDLPPAFRSKVATSFLQFQNTVNNGLNFLRFDLGKERDEKGKWGVFKAGLMWLGTLLVLNRVYKEFGIPTPIDGWTDIFPLISMAEYGPPVTYSGLWAIKDFTFAKTPQDRGMAIKALRRAAFLFLPAGNQIRKTLEGILAVSKGGKFDKRGKLQFSIREGSEQIRAVAFGPYGTKEGKKYIEQGFRAKPKTSGLRLLR